MQLGMGGDVPFDAADDSQLFDSRQFWYLLLAVCAVHVPTGRTCVRLTSAVSPGAIDTTYYST